MVLITPLKAAAQAESSGQESSPMRVSFFFALGYPYITNFSFSHTPTFNERRSKKKAELHSLPPLSPTKSKPQKIIAIIPKFKEEEEEERPLKRRLRSTF